MADSDAVRQRRRRAHKRGDHSLCRPSRCHERAWADRWGPEPEPADEAVGELIGQHQERRADLLRADIAARQLASVIESRRDLLLWWRAEGDPLTSFWTGPGRDFVVGLVCAELGLDPADSDVTQRTTVPDDLSELLPPSEPQA